MSAYPDNLNSASLNAYWGNEQHPDAYALEMFMDDLRALDVQIRTKLERGFITSTAEDAARGLLDYIGDAIGEAERAIGEIGQ
jgi:hypothetical protein